MNIKKLSFAIGFFILAGIFINNTLLNEPWSFKKVINEVNPPEITFAPERKIQITDGVKHSVPLEAIRGGGPPKDGIPSIDDPEFVSVSEANKYLDDDGLGIAVTFNGIDRFYPNQILVWHEIVNDNVGGQAIAVTYCPLCGTGIVYNPLVNGVVTEFGTSGKLWNSNLVMYDRQTDSYWSQALGEAIKGKMTGAKLELLPYDNMFYDDWKKDHPNGEVLSKETGHSRDYSQDPYGDYYQNRSLYFPVDFENDDIHPKEITFGLELNGSFKAYTLTELTKGPGSFLDKLGEVDLSIEFNKSNNTIDIRRTTDQTEVIPSYGFWFSWFSVHPDTEIYEVAK